MDGRNEIAAIVHSHVGLVVKDGVDMAIIGFFIFTLNSVGGNTIFAHQCSSDIVLR
jgi:hypothetical protein